MHKDRRENVYNFKDYDTIDWEASIHQKVFSCQNYHHLQVGDG